MAGCTLGSMTLEIYWGAGSPFAWRVLLAAELKQIPYESKLIEFSTGFLKSPEFLAMNPRGTVPIIREGDFVLSESLAIMEYIDRKHPNPPLFGRTPEETGRIWEAIAIFESYMRDPVTRVLNGWVFGDKPRTQEIDDHAAKVKDELGRLEARLAPGSWMLGDTVTAADLAWFPAMRTILRAGERREARTRELGLFPFVEYPKIGAWIARVETLPGYDKTFPPHWRKR